VSTVEITAMGCTTIDQGHVLTYDISHLNENAATKGAAAGGNLSQVPPLEKGEFSDITTPTRPRSTDHLTEWLFPEVYANKHGARIVSNILGPKPEVHFIRSNTLIATDERSRSLLRRLDLAASLRSDGPPFVIRSRQ
jgi:hypothetical protein